MYNESYKTCKTIDQDVKRFQRKIMFWPKESSKRISELVYSGIEKGCKLELVSLHHRYLTRDSSRISYMLLRRYLIDARKNPDRCLQEGAVCNFSCSEFYGVYVNYVDFFF